MHYCGLLLQWAIQPIPNVQLKGASDPYFLDIQLVLGVSQDHTTTDTRIIRVCIRYHNATPLNLVSFRRLY
jgi:hypothetical protein